MSDVDLTDAININSGIIWNDGIKVTLPNGEMWNDFDEWW